MLSFFFSSRRRHTRCSRDWSSDVCSSDLEPHTLDQTGGDHVPGVGEHQDPPLPMEPPERLRLIALTRPFHRLSWDTQTYRFGAEVLGPLRLSRRSRSFAPAALRMTGQFVPRRGKAQPPDGVILSERAARAR